MKPKKNRKPGRLDNCQTPPYALEPVFSVFWQHDMVWEPAAGEGYMVRALASYDFGVVGSDILKDGRWDYHDFLEDDPSMYIEMCDCIVTNPPYSRKIEWLQRCIEIELPFALLLPVETLGSRGFLELDRGTGLSIIFMYPRVDFKMPDAGWGGGGAQFPVCWVLGYSGLVRQTYYIQELDKPSKKEIIRLDEEGKI